MQRIVCDERVDWRETAEDAGFEFHTIDGERYWDERAYYGFTLQEIERDSRRSRPSSTACAASSWRARSPTNGSCARSASRAVLELDRGKRQARGREPLWPLRLRYDGSTPQSSWNNNADTPTAVFETAVFQWMWLEQAIERQIVPAVPTSTIRCTKS